MRTEDWILAGLVIIWFLYASEKKKDSCPAGYSPYTSYDPVTDTFSATCQQIGG